jgi:cytochrome c-type biogenesis protein CcmH/NrfG
VNDDRELQQIELLTDELADLDAQVADGELDVETADRLRTRYVRELDAAISRRSPDASGDAGTSVATPRRRRMSRRSMFGTVGVVVAIAVIGVSAAISLTSTPTSGVEGLVEEILSGEGRDLSEVSNDEMEAVVAENPGVVPMRLALARRYFEAGDFDKALDHYFVILEVERNPEALANVGWMTYLSGHPEVAAGYVEAALERDPTSLTAHWYIGNIYVTLGRGDEAIVHLAVVASDLEIPVEVRDSAIELIRQVEASRG